MRQTWQMINSLNCRECYKNALFLVLMMLAGGVLGGLTWLVLLRQLLSETIWLLCCIGYPAFFAGFIGGIWYLYRHSFN